MRSSELMPTPVSRRRGVRWEERRIQPHAQRTGDNDATALTLGVGNELDGDVQWLVDSVLVGERRDS